MLLLERRFSAWRVCHSATVTRVSRDHDVAGGRRRSRPPHPSPGAHRIQDGPGPRPVLLPVTSMIGTQGGIRTPRGPGLSRPRLPVTPPGQVVVSWVGARGDDPGSVGQRARLGVADLRISPGMRPRLRAPLDDNPTTSARRRPRGGSNSPHLIDNQAASPDAYEGKHQRFSVRCGRWRPRGDGHPLSRPAHTVYNCHLRLVNLSFHSLALFFFDSLFRLGRRRWSSNPHPPIEDR